ncbi:MAG: N-acetylmuramoyl-L-alanine amidase [Lysobacterales bacterium]
MANPRDYQFDLPSSGRPADVALPEFWYPGIRDYWERSTSSRIFDAILGVRAVVIHATAGGSSSGAVSVMRDGKASFHWLVPDEDEPQHGQLVWACAPEARAAWHVRNAAHHPDVNGDARKVNHWSLGIEVVNTQVNDPFSDWQVAITAQIVRYCWAKYPNLKHIVSHAKLDPNRRSDPGSGFPWAEFKRQVLQGQETGVPALATAATDAADVVAPPNADCCEG